MKSKEIIIDGVTLTVYYNEIPYEEGTNSGGYSEIMQVIWTDEKGRETDIFPVLHLDHDMISEALKSN